MNSLKQKSKYVLTFVSGALLVGLLQVTSLKASTTEPTGSCILMGNYSTLGVSLFGIEGKLINEITYIDFDAKTYEGVFTNAAMFEVDAPEYNMVGPDSGSFELLQGPIPGTYRYIPDGLDLENDMLIASTNGGNTFMVMDTNSGLTGVCQKL